MTPTCSTCLAIRISSISGFEQQGAIVEEYVCCRALAPDAPRTKRLHEMLSEALPVADLPGARREHDVLLPWKGVQLEGICG